MTNKISHIEAYILAGGKSSRMGSDKGLLLLKGKSLIERVIEQLKPLFGKITIVSNNPEYKRFGLEVIDDLIKDAGPAGGIHAALSHTASKQIFSVSCDMPFISTHAVTFMIQNASHAQITLPEYHGKIEPLFGIYSKECLPPWHELIASGIIKLQEMINRFDLLELNIENNKFFNEVTFMNINYRNDLNKALQQL